MSEKYDPAYLFPPDRFIKLSHVAVFDEHEMPHAKGGKPKKVTEDDLKRIAATCNKKFVTVGAATALALGHTKEEADEHEQPEIVGWATDFSVDKFGKTGKKALYCDWYIRRKYEHVIESYPHRSVEWWRDRDDLNPISLLRTAPERDLPIIRYSKTPDGDVYRYSFTPTLPPSPNSENRIMNDDEKTKVADAVAGESSSNTQLAAEVAGLKEQLGQLTSMFQELMQMVQSEGGEGGGDGDGKEPADDLLAQAGDEGDDKAGDDEADNSEGADDQDKEGDKKAAKVPEKMAADGEPEQYAADAGPTNTFTPGMEKTKMSRDADKELVAKYERMAAKMVKDATDVIMKENEDLRVQYNRGKAEKAVAGLETDHNIDFGTDADREEETTLLTNLLAYDKAGKSFATHCDKIARKYKRKESSKPDSPGAAKVVQFSRTPEDNKPAFGTPDDVTAFVKAHSEDASLTPEGWAARKNGKK